MGSTNNFLTRLLFQAGHLIRLAFILNLQLFILQTHLEFLLLQSYLYRGEALPNSAAWASSAQSQQMPPFALQLGRPILVLQSYINLLATEKCVARNFKMRP